VSLDLIHHLIEHSDKSTAAKRVQPTGPRKYKRRRKLNDEESVNSDSKCQRINLKYIKQEPVEKATINSNGKKGPLMSSFEKFIPNSTVTDFNLPDEILSTREKKAADAKPSTSHYNNKATSSRPKMIFTEKTRVPMSDGKRKSRMMIQKQILNRNQVEKTTRHLTTTTTRKRAAINVSQLQKNDEEEYDVESNEGSETCSNEDDPNEDVLHTLMKRERKLSEKFTIDLVNDLQDILRSPIKTSITIDEMDEPLIDIPSMRRNNRRTYSRYEVGGTSSMNGTKKDYEVENGDQSESEMERVVVKQESCHSCQICSDTFSSREELLAHVPIHI
jgi:KRAB domain-containing zinc finger protein